MGGGMLRVALINRFFPPDPAVTGWSAQELVRYLGRHVPDLEVRVLAGSGRYRGGLRQVDSAHVRRISSLPLGGHGPLRLMASLWDGYRLAKRAVLWADVVISLTDPPLLGFWIGEMIAASERKIRWIEWTMDLYPEAFVAGAFVRRHAQAYGYVSRRVRQHLPDRYICLGPGQHATVQRLRGCVRPATILPCGIVEPTEPAGPSPAWRAGERRVIIAYAGNLGEAHCAEALIELVRCADAERFKFVFALYGSKAGRAVAALKDCRNIVWQRHLGHKELAHADVHLVSLKREWAHISVPSKAVSAVCLGKPLLFIGPAEADTMTLLGEAAWNVPDQTDGRYDSEDLRRVLARIDNIGERISREAAARRIHARLLRGRDAAFEEIAVQIRCGAEGVDAACDGRSVAA